MSQLLTRIVLFTACLSIIGLVNAKHSHQHRNRLQTRAEDEIVRHCDTADPDLDIQAELEWLKANEAEENDLWDSTTVEQRIYRRGTSMQKKGPDDPKNTDVKRRQNPNAIYSVNLWMHIIQDVASSRSSHPRYVATPMLRRQMGVLNDAFRQAGVSFRLVNFTRTTNDTWARGGDNTRMKRTLRKGTYSTLNLYYQTMLQFTDTQTGIRPGTTLLGLCLLPAFGITKRTDPQIYAMDGCNIHAGTLPGGWQTNYNTGGTTIHEVGHWNGLLHTFQNQSCAIDNPGDFVADTPQQRDPTLGGCPIGKDSCRDSGVDPQTYGPSPYDPQGYAGLDPIHNYMDYSYDACYTNFTPGQAARMINFWNLCRKDR